jgi:glycerol dehydrogenase-like iron-containing ADH family enzyme
MPGVERQNLYAKYYDRLTPAQRQEFLLRNFENSQAAEAELNSYVQKNRSEAQFLQQRTARLREITEAWRNADSFIESVDTYLSGKRDSSEDLKLKGELEKQYTEVANQLRDAQSTIHHTPFETSQKIELLQKNSDYRSRVDNAMKRLSGK